jgi:riboflavin kinase/FMN adenylyltransferase
MKLGYGLEDWRGMQRPLCIAAGFFDGIHRGHVRLIAAARERARALGGEAWTLTFDPHPMRVLHPQATPRLITSLAHKLRIFDSLGLDGCMIVAFTPELSRRTPAAFLEGLRACAPTLAYMVVGRNWRFGRGRAGTPAVLSRAGRRLGFGVSIMRPVVRGGAPVSSSRVREAIRHGRLDEAAELLGRPVTVLGSVTRGRRLGRRIGYPTANIEPSNELLPPLGIYAVRGVLDGAIRPGVVSYGRRPTINTDPDAPPVLEIHLFDFDGDVYGRELEIQFIRKLRNEQRFESLEALRAQIGLDVAEARRILAAYHKKAGSSGAWSAGS